jgi:CxxC-x17-CxxC domain-containing protein
MFEDKVLICAECGKEFVWTAGEQEFYAERGFQNEPKRCPECRRARKAQRNGAQNGERVMHDAVCARCGKPCKVPFEPSGDRPVYCSECFAEIQAERRGQDSL